MPNLFLIKSRIKLRLIGTYAVESELNVHNVLSIRIIVKRNDVSKLCVFESGKFLYNILIACSTPQEIRGIAYTTYNYVLFSLQCMCFVGRTLVNRSRTANVRIQQS